MKWICSICGCVQEGVTAPENCPVCRAPSSAFHAESIPVSPAPVSPEPLPSFRVCSVCGYQHDGTIPPASCPICHAPATMFR